LPRRSFLRRAGGIVAAVLAAEAVAARRDAAEAKTPQTAVHYQATPKDGKACAACTFFAAPAACKVVAGVISPQGWCALYAEKATP
jgi:hypothetical protein